MHNIGFERFRIELICDYPCVDKYQLIQKEGEYIRNIGTLNKTISGRTHREYIMDNIEKVRQYDPSPQPSPSRGERARASSFPLAP